MNKTKPTILGLLVTAAAVTGCGADLEEESSSSSSDTTDITLSVADINAVREKNSGATTSVSFNVKLSDRVDEDVEISYSISTDGSGLDFEYPESPLVIEKNTKAGTVVVTLLGDDTDEPDETITFTVDSASLSSITFERSEASTTIIDDDDPAVIGFLEDTQSFSETIGAVVVPVELESVSEFDVTADIAVSGTSLLGGDYTIDSTSISIPAGDLETSITLEIIEDLIPEGGETIILSITPLTNTALDSDVLASTYTGVIQGTVSVADTGVVTFSDGTRRDIAKEPSDYPGQDASYGLDVTATNDADGDHGFSFTKLDIHGNPLPSSSSDWACVQDNVTGVVWENKTSGVSLVDSDTEEFTELSGNQWRSYSMYYKWRAALDDDTGGNYGSIRTSSNQLAPDSPNNGYCAYLVSDSRPFKLYCDTLSYLDEMNYHGVCGFDDWRMPEIEELRSIANLGNTDNAVPDSDFFPRIVTDSQYYSGTPASDNEASAWCYDFGTGTSQLCRKVNYQRFMPVRKSQ
tara:strand:- start:601 stop:2163 length:1563 start_codon:yes stop_codon:yes gene_type:complete